MPNAKHRPLIVPIFIPHLGCPHQCIFCQQKTITSQSDPKINKQEIVKILETAINSPKFHANRNPQVAFYGGTFTNLSLGLMEKLLDEVSPYIKKGFFNAIRVSTRPDTLDSERLEMMKYYGVRTVELGTQSMDDNVLRLSKRGHSADDTVNAVHQLQHFGFKVGIQLMPGLPGDSNKIFKTTVTKILQLKPDMVRLYPALVIKGTKLAQLYLENKYKPLELKEAVETCIESCIRFEAQNIPVIRIGLMSSPDLLEKGAVLAGPWHPSFGFLVRSGLYRNSITPLLPESGVLSKITISVQSKEESLLRGHQNSGIQWIEQQTGAKDIKIEADDNIPFGIIRF